MKPGHTPLAVQPSRSSLSVWMLLCLIVSLALVLLIIQPALAQKKLTAAEAGSPEVIRQFPQFPVSRRLCGFQISPCGRVT